MTIWQVLGLKPDAERDAIRRAYAKKLRVTHPEDDPEGFKALRAAYEQALAHAEHRVMWARFDQDEDAPDETADTVWHEIDAAPTRPDWTTAPAQMRHTDADVSALLAERETDLTVLRAAMTALETGLRGPWRASDAELEVRLRAILDAAAMGELGIRDDAEAWLAELIVETIPASDAILRQAVEAFGWDDGNARHYAVHQVLERLDEWRLIAALGQHGHRYHAGWRSLTGAAGNAFLWRIDALRPSVRRGAAALLGALGEASPGLHYSFDAASVSRWEAHFAQPRLTLGMLMQVPVLSGVLLSAVHALDDRTPLMPLILLCVLLACAAPAVTLLVLVPWRRDRRQHGLSRRQERDWLAEYGALLMLAGLMPGLGPLLLLPNALQIAVRAFLAKPEELAETAGVGLGVVAWAAALFLTLPLIDVLSAAQVSALGTAALLFVYLRVWHRREAGAILDAAFGEQREWWLLGIVLGAAGLSVGITALHSLWAPVVSFYPVALCLLAAALPLGVVAPGGGPPRWIARVAMALAFLAAGVDSLPPDKPAAPYTAAGTVPLADGGKADGANDDLLTSAGSAPRALAAMERVQPAFAGVRTGDPALYAALRTDLEPFYAGKATRAAATAAFARRVDTAYRARLPDAEAGLLLESQRIRLSVLSALAKVDVAACADEGIKPFDPTLLTEAQRNRQNAQIYNVLANPPVPRAAQGDATPLSTDTLLANTATMLDLTRQETAARIAGRSGAQARCDARIAMLTIMVEMPRDAVVAMLRRELRRSATP